MAISGGGSDASSSQSSSADTAVVQAVTLEAIAMAAHNQVSVNHYSPAKSYTQQAAAVNVDSENNDNSKYHSM